MIFKLAPSMLTLSSRLLLISIVPAVASGALFELLLGHRHDYTGHFSAGYGATLAVYMVWLKQLRTSQFAIWALRGNLVVCVICILLGALTEATIFRIAKFDEIDFCNQSLGAVLAALVALAHSRDQPFPARQYDQSLIVAIAFLGAGGCYAVA
jgi:hypothetical protein